MRADVKNWAGAKTWLLAAIAGWALCIWALGLFGLGSRIKTLPDDPSLLQRLPQPSKPGPERLGPLGQYAEIGARPLFSDDRRPQPFFINPEGEGEEQNTFDYMLTSVLITPRLSMAIVQPTGGGDPVRLKIGQAPDAAPAWSLTSVKPRSVVFTGPEGDRSLDLRVFDGTGGEAPTSIAGPVLGSQGGKPQPVMRQPVVAPPPPATAPVPTSSQPAQQPPAPTPAAGTDTPEAQAEAIRQRIEARRAQLQEQSKAASTKTP